MKRPAVFFDRDNTLIVGHEYLGDPDDVVLMQGAADAVSRAKALGFATIVISNQSGVARGMFSEADVRAVNTRLEDYLREENPNAVIDRQEFCPFHPDGTVERYKRESELRKPRPGMILKAAELLALDLGRSWVIGDAPRDIEAGRAAGCRTILFQPPDVPPSPAADEASPVQPDFQCTTLREAIDHIASHNHHGHRDDRANPPAAPASTSHDIVITPAGVSAPVPAARVPINRPSDSADLHRLERLGEQILEELKRQHEQQPDFSVSKLMAGITQILSIAILFVAYLNRAYPNDVMYPMIFTAVFTQLLTIALLIMDRQR